MKNTVVLFLLLISSFLFGDEPISVERISLPPGFAIEVYAAGLPQVRQMCFAGDGTLFAGSKAGNVYAVTPDKKVITLITGLNMPVGVDYFEGDLYFSEITRILKFKDILKNLHKKKIPFSVVNDSFPNKEWHGWKYIRVGPDRKLYVPIGGPCNVCESKDPRFATLMRMDLNGKGLEVYASGIRNTVGFDWDPATGELWFSDNGRDWMGDNAPPDEINHAPVQGLFFGFPYVFGATNQDTMLWKNRPTNLVFTAPELLLPAHIAPLGMRFYTNGQFPEHYRKGFFLAEHGSWNRLHKHGYRVVFIELRNNKPVKEEIFAEGWLSNEVNWGRPNDVCAAPDGSLFISDDFAHCIYRVTYTNR